MEWGKFIAYMTPAFLALGFAVIVLVRDVRHNDVPMWLLVCAQGASFGGAILSFIVFAVSISG